ncbi:MAG: hypothetical protein IKW96_02205 [Ruminococcus sp.]|uniref:hypothetical protein n=1 Tax=Ruminococcus sp. TaxID=41978 RepID=UPI002600C287|nr:hypothetical protein [Ruminococcus sp.]MBR5682083.1 hypothetical protein [Ruminococcus sp.]
MKLRRNAAFAAALALLVCSASCSRSSGKVGSAELPTELVTVEGVDINDAVEAAAGDAYLAITDEAWEVQYLGNKDVNGSDQLSYDAGVAHINGNGEYTVSVTADTNGFRYDETGDINGEYTIKGIGFAAVIIDNAEEVLPNAVITINSVKVDGKELELRKKSYTNTESGSIRANIFNEWVSDDALPADARTAEGALFENGDTSKPTAVNDGSCSAQIIDRSEFAEWKNVEVGFTVSGL